MTEACTGRSSLHLQVNEFSMNNLVVDHSGLEIAKLVLKVSLSVLSTKEVDSIKDRITFSV